MIDVGKYPSLSFDDGLKETSVDENIVPNSCTCWRGHKTSPIVVSLIGRLPQKSQSKSTLSCEIVQTQSVSSRFYKETEIKIELE